MDPSISAVNAPAIQAVATTVSTFTADAVMNGTATLVGAFLGAMLAFIFQMVFQYKQDRKTEKLAAHRILFCLLQQINTIILTQRDFIEPHLNDPLKFLSIPAIQEFDINKHLFDFSSFGFLLQSKAGRMVMYDLYLAQESYIETLRSLNERSRLHRHEMQPKLAAAGVGFQKEVTIPELHAALGPFIFETMITSTDQTLDIMRRTFLKLAAVKESFRAHAVGYFKTDDFTNFDIPETYGLLDEQHNGATPDHEQVKA